MGKWIDRVKSFATNTMACYLDFVVPVSIFMVFNLCADMQTRDPEKYGLLWLHFADTEPAERAAKFPLPEAEGAASGASARTEAKLDAQLEMDD